MQTKPDLITHRADRSRAEVAAAIGISENYLGRIERGERGVSLLVAIGFRNLYGIDIETWLPQTDPTTGGRQS